MDSGFVVMDRCGLHVPHYTSYRHVNMHCSDMANYIYNSLLMRMIGLAIVLFSGTNLYTDCSDMANYNSLLMRMIGFAIVLFSGTNLYTD